MNTIKHQLLKACKNYVLEKEKTVSQIISSHQRALTSETKSSAGDKHETGRAMIQLEMEKASQQLTVIDQMKLTLDRISLDDNSNTIKLGSLAITNKHNYFLAISVGEIQVKNEIYYAVSSLSPIGKLLLGKKVGDEFEFNGSNVIEELY